MLETDSTTPAGPSFWATVREALRGTEQDLTTVPITRAVVLLAVPMVLEMSMESLFAVVDIFFVSRLGAASVATVGLTESLLSLTYALAMGLSAGATAIIARKTGAKDSEGAGAAAAQVITVAAIGAAVLGIVGAALGGRLLEVMGASPNVVQTGSTYTSVIMGGSITIFLLFIINAIFRSAGDAAVAMRTLWLANGINFVIAPALIFGIGPIPRMGVTGAAVATTASRCIGVIYQIVKLRRGRDRLPIRAASFVPQTKLVTDLLRLASTASLQVLIETASWLGLVRILSSYGSIALAGYTIAMRVVIFALLPSWGLANAAATLVGQNLGAKQPDRSAQSVATIARYNVRFLGAVGVVFALAPHFIVGLFTNEREVVDFGSDCLRIVALGFVVFAHGMVTIQAFNGAGDTVTPMLVNFGAFWLFKLPLAYLLSRVAGLGPRGVFIAITAAYAMQALVSWLLFRRGRWRNIAPPST